MLMKISAYEIWHIARDLCLNTPVNNQKLEEDRQNLIEIDEWIVAIEFILCYICVLEIFHSKAKTNKHIYVS